jgi:hypothetical protein
MKFLDGLGEFKYQIADKLFAKELDEAYDMGIRMGAEFATRTLSFRVSLNSEKVKMTPTEKKGYEKAIQVIEDVKPEIYTRAKVPF